MTAAPQERAEELLEAFDLFDTWEDRYAYLIDLGRQLPPLDEADRTEENRIQGCQSRVWLAAHPRQTDGETVIDLTADSDSAIVKGLAAVLLRVTSGQTPQAILRYDIEGLLNRLELGEHLSMNRRNGLRGMIQHIKAIAEAAQRAAD